MDPNALISEHLRYREFWCHCGTPYPEEWVMPRLAPLSLPLEKIRGVWNRRMTILSGYRTHDYNRRIGGATMSQHCEGRAADIIIEDVSTLELHAKVLELHLTGVIKIGGLGLYAMGGFVHIDIRDVAPLVRWTGDRLSNVAPPDPMA